MLELVKQKQETTLEVIHNLQEVILQMLELTQEVNKHYIWKRKVTPSLLLWFTLWQMDL